MIKKKLKAMRSLKVPPDEWRTLITLDAINQPGFVKLSSE